MKNFLPAFCFGLCLIFFTRASNAQEFEQGETLSKPASAPTEVGFFKQLNSLPESVRKSSAFARLLHQFKLSAGSDGYIDVDARLASFEQSKADLIRDAAVSYKSLGSKLPVFADAWQNIGPSSTNPPASAGCTKALAVDPSNVNIVYAGAAAGGVWKTTNATATTPTWTALTDLVIPDLAVASIAIDPSNPSTLYVGSGDPSIAIDGLGGSGLYKSTNSGGSWSKIASTTFSRTVNKVLVHPTNSSIVFACNYGSNLGIYRSTNGGTSFTKVFPTTGFAKGVIWDIIPAQTIGNKLIMYMVEGNNPGGNSAECGVYKSVDDGATWAKLTLSGLPTGDQFGKSALAIPRNNLSTVYCFVAQPDGNLKALYQSINSGALFTPVTTVPTTVFKPSGQQAAQGWYDLYLAVTPGSATNDTIFIGGVEAYRSFNRGTSWQSYSDYQNHFDIHVDHQSIAVDPINPKRVWIGTDGGVYRSTDAGQNWSYKSSGMQTMRVYHIGLDKSDFKRTFAGFQDQGMWRTYSGQAPYWSGLGDGFQPIVDPTNSNTVYGEQPNGDLVKSTSGGTAGSFNDINPPTTEETEWDTPFKMAPKNNQTLFTGRVRLWRTTNGGSGWSAVSSDFYSGSTIESIGLSPANPNIYMIGYGGGKIQLTTDAGTNWAEKSSGIPSALVRSIVCHPTDPDFAVIGLSSSSTSSARVMRTTNGGTSWTNVSGATGHLLPGATVNCVALDSVNPSSIWYAATNNGIYYTMDAGANWSIAGSGIGLAPCNDVQVHANKVTIRVGTHGRSIWEANTNILPVELTGLTAIKTSKGTELHWKTDSELNSSGFWVQRSFNYEPFEDLGFVAGAGTSNTELNYSFLDAKMDAGYYIFRLKQVDLDGSEHLSNTVDLSYGNAAALRLDQNFPNPFVLGQTAIPSTRIRYFLPENEIVTLKLYTAAGIVIRTLVNNELRAAGEQNEYWDGTDASGVRVASGGYFYTLETEHNGNVTKKMVLLGE